MNRRLAVRTAIVQLASVTEINKFTESVKGLAVPIDSITLNPMNSQKNHDVHGIAAALNEYGQPSPLVVHKKTKIILKGNGTYKAAVSLGWTQVAVSWVDYDADDTVGYEIADNLVGKKSIWDVDHVLLNMQSLPEDYQIPGADAEFIDLVFGEMEDTVNRLLAEPAPSYEPPRQSPAEFQPPQAATVAKLQALQESIGAKTIDEAIEHVMNNQAVAPPKGEIPPPDIDHFFDSEPTPAKVKPPTMVKCPHCEELFELV